MSRREMPKERAKKVKKEKELERTKVKEVDGKDKRHDIATRVEE